MQEFNVPRQLARLAAAALAAAASITAAGPSGPEAPPLARPALQIADGADADIADWPGIAALGVDYGGGLLVIDCTAVMIDAWHALTAEHCVRGAASDFRLIVGRADLAAAGEADHFDLAEIHRHPDYVDAWSGGHDLAVLRLARPYPGAVLPLADAQAGPAPGERARIAGYGRRVDGGAAVAFLRQSGGPARAPSPRLQETPMTVLGSDECRLRFAAMPGPDPAVTERHICVQGRSLDTGEPGAPGTLPGDSGAPLVAWVSGAATVVGINSFGGYSGAAGARISGLTRLSAFRGWIDAVRAGAP